MTGFEKKLPGALARLLLEIAFVGASIEDVRSVSEIAEALKSARPNRPEPYIVNALCHLNAGNILLTEYEIESAKKIAPNSPLICEWEKIINDATDHIFGSRNI